MHDDSRLVELRIRRFVEERLRPAIHRDHAPLAVTAWEAPGEPVPFAEARWAKYAPVREGAWWGRPWGTTWFHVTGRVPTEWLEGRDTLPVELRVDVGFTPSRTGFQAEALAFDATGRVIKAVEPRQQWLPVDGEDVDVYIEAASNPDFRREAWDWQPTRMGDKATAGCQPLYQLRSIELRRLDREVWELERDVQTLLELHDILPAGSSRRAQILRGLERLLDVTDPFNMSRSAKIGREVLAPVLAAPASASAHRVFAVGHAHIDSAWLWPTRETVRKCARTFSNVLSLMDDDEDFVFACSSAQQYAWVKDAYPDVFERLRARVADGRFVPVGGMWVESDTNMVGGEAMVRQFVHGQRFFQREFGRPATVGWLPDSFGYSGALPQILRGAGITDFLTQKLSWNDTDRFPHHTFWWEGIDGTRVFTHFPPVDSYDSDLSMADLERAERQYAEKGAANSSLVPFGYGDGGGGPTREMLGTMRRQRSLEGSPCVVPAAPEVFFARAKAEYAEPPTWSGELYLEAHRGTFTSQSRTKQGNRRSESLLHEAELWATTAHVREGHAYPYDDLDDLWETVLLQQFHDILPGSSIAWVHREAEQNYRVVADRLEAHISEALGVLCGGEDSEAAIAANSAPVAIAGVPAMSIGAVRSTGTVEAVSVDGQTVLENELLRVVVDETGRIRSLVEKSSGRDSVPPGSRAAELQLFIDTPAKWDAWDIDRHYARLREVLTEVDELVVQSMPTEATVTVRRHHESTRISQVFSVRAGSPVLEITTSVDWHERQRLLKLAFPIDVNAGRAAYEVQFGHVFRSTHSNTSWDSAQYETPSHRWVHVGEPGFGVVIANDSTYGHDVTQRPRPGGGVTTVVRESLLRAPLFPDPESDQGEHVLRTSVRAGADVMDAVCAGYELNFPLRHLSGRGVEPLFRLDTPNVVIETVKLAEDRSGDVIVRLYEAAGSRSKCVLACDFDVTEVLEADLLERTVRRLAIRTVEGSAVQLELRPFEIVTLRVKR